mmetsp:Transcript_5086/g.7777  ORF Transcript_5086/g.7777 Transcript_5086/m.7777 type:complete len:319 (+) Transcript_5086:4157-5113(+)
MEMESPALRSSLATETPPFIRACSLTSNPLAVVILPAVLRLPSPPTEKTPLSLTFASMRLKSSSFDCISITKALPVKSPLEYSTTRRGAAASSPDACSDFALSFVFSNDSPPDATDNPPCTNKPPEEICTPPESISRPPENILTPARDRFPREVKSNVVTPSTIPRIMLELSPVIALISSREPLNCSCPDRSSSKGPLCLFVSMVIPSGLSAKPEPIVRESSTTAEPCTSREFTILILCAVTRPSSTANDSLAAVSFPIVWISPPPVMFSTPIVRRGDTSPAVFSVRGAKVRNSKCVSDNCAAVLITITEELVSRVSA